MVVERRYSCSNGNSSFSHRSEREDRQSRGEHGGAIKIKLHAPALEGKANAALRTFLAEELKISERRIVLERGQKSREKVIRIEGLSEEEVRSRLLATI